MPGVLLKSGKVAAYEALGTSGAPAYRSADQLRAVISRRSKGVNTQTLPTVSTPPSATLANLPPFADTAQEQKDESDLKELFSLSRHLAIPQINDSGDVIDWYSPVKGNVIAWSTATETEKILARAMLDEFKADVLALAAEIEKGEKTGANARVSQLLPLAQYAPGPDHTFLVGADKIPVLTFWGFVDPADNNRAPLHFLYPQPAAPVMASAIETAPAAAGATVLETPLPPTSVPLAQKPTPEPSGFNWRRWLWLALLLALLAALLLFLLRGCTPAGLTLPGIKGPDLALPSVNLPKVDLPSIPSTIGTLHPAASLPATTVTGVALPADGTPPLNMPQGASPSVNTPKLPEVVPGPTEPTVPDAVAPPANPTLASSPLQNSQPAEKEKNLAIPPGPVDKGKHLVIPPGLDNGIPGFLNGNWRAGAGIQDTVTGQPVGLEYDFSDGTGKVTVNRGNGQRCSGPVSAAMQQGHLLITPGSAASCDDGSSFVLPAVNCTPNGSGDATCTGIYNDKRVPMSMKSQTP